MHLTEKSNCFSNNGKLHSRVNLQTKLDNMLSMTGKYANWMSQPFLSKTSCTSRTARKMFLVCLAEITYTGNLKTTFN